MQEISDSQSWEQEKLVSPQKHTIEYERTIKPPKEEIEAAGKRSVTQMSIVGVSFHYDKRAIGNDCCDYIFYNCLVYT